VSEASGPRAALGQELRFLARQHPREGWAKHARLGALASFWLQRHAAFRELDRSSGAAASKRSTSATSRSGCAAGSRAICR
jgi:hypothetical protein